MGTWAFYGRNSYLTLERKVRNHYCNYWACEMWCGTKPRLKRGETKPRVVRGDRLTVCKARLSWSCTEKHTSVRCKANWREIFYLRPEFHCLAKREAMRVSRPTAIRISNYNWWIRKLHHPKWKNSFYINVNVYYTLTLIF